MPPITWTTLTIDCDDDDVDRLAAFYGAVLGWEVTATDGAAWRQLRDPAGGVGINIQGEPGYRRPVWPDDPDRPSKMMHLELLVSDVAAAVALVVEHGGSVAVPQPHDRDPARLRVVLDPAGHPCCLFASGE